MKADEYPMGSSRAGSRIIVTTTHQIEGSEIAEYLQVLGSEVILGANIFKDALAQIRDVVGGRTAVYEKVYSDARSRALELLREQASHLSADAIVGVRLDFQALGQDNGMHMVAATGTAVRLIETPDILGRRSRAAAAQRARAIKATLEDQAQWHVEIQGKDRGPFSVAQIRELLTQGRIEGSAIVRAAGGAETTAAEIID